MQASGNGHTNLVIRDAFGEKLKISNNDADATSTSVTINSSPVQVNYEPFFRRRVVHVTGDLSTIYIGNTVAALYPSNRFTFLAWVRTSGTQCGATVFASFGGNYSIARGAEAGQCGQLVFTANNVTVANVDVPPHTWTHVAMVVGSSTATVYINGNYQMSTGISGASDLGVFSVGHTPVPTAASLLMGDLANVAVYADVEMTSTDIASAFANKPGTQFFVSRPGA